MIEASIGLGIFLSLVFSELIGVMAGGIVVPGYIALHLHEPLRVLGTIAVAFAVFGILKLCSLFMFLYGKRRLVLAILLGFILGYLTRQYFFYDIFGLDVRLYSIGFIIPGLIANWMERQGVVRTVSMLLITAVIVKLTTMILSGGVIG
ncbi:poly-gamma-glutamate biosynthesis protein PgsC [bacterium]|nr:poly-gamma-glutamate biosynthesis protein PgsC [bacterium]